MCLYDDVCNLWFPVGLLQIMSLLCAMFVVCFSGGVLIGVVVGACLVKFRGETHSHDGTPRKLNHEKAGDRTKTETEEPAASEEIVFETCEGSQDYEVKGQKNPTLPDFIVSTRTGKCYHLSEKCSMIAGRGTQKLQLCTFCLNKAMKVKSG